MNPRYLPLFETLVFPNGIELKNRIAIAPMTHYSSNDDGSTADEEFPYVARRAKHVGLFLTACYAVTENGKAYPGEPLLTDDRFVSGIARIAQIIKGCGATAVLQLHHGGGVCPPELVPGGDVVAPSAVETPGRSHVTPRKLSADEIDGIIESFGEATRRAIDAGFNGVELHGAYGYLLQQFLSPYTNRRNDRWSELHSFPLEVIRKVQNVVKSYATEPFLVGYRFTPEEALSPGLNMTHALEFTEALVRERVNFIDVLVNNYASKPRVGLADLSESRLSLISRQVAGRTVLLGGGSIYRAEDGLAALQTGVNVITLGREMVMEPEWAEKVAQGKEAEIVTTLVGASRSELNLPTRFWNTIWSAPGWFPGV